MGYIWENNFGAFLVLTVIIGGGAAYMSGRALANQWRPLWLVLAYMVPMALVSRFLHYALFQGSLLSVPHLIIDFIVLAAIAAFSYRLNQTSQMVKQYGWLYERQGLLSWREKQAENA